ncbi:formimidoylglutamate deiminase [Herbiconiux ginsengi]|uniref:Formiminoglutamate deiminase n=1 Tax=Herbiconiux ginsengi TaxID=381665 RepID=A0A1H3SS44_9MICO|nr:formimidoylglutamate deiminase [Herbiconiux ginsengi]SDZ40782.1 formiminoglutamate deiminase [Herbiconiux ginsengi]
MSGPENAFAGVWCATVVGEDGVEHDVRFEADGAGRIRHRAAQQQAQRGDLRLGTVLAGAGNAHSHAFHRALRGRTHDGGGDFWQWRDSMYAVAAALEPESSFTLARAVFAEMLVAGYTAVGEFHYLHHRPDGSAYPHAFEQALVAAATEVGIRLTLLDTAYLQAGPGRALEPAQRRFGDRDAAAYLSRWHALRELVPALGAALHSVRAVPPAAVAEIVAGLPSDVPLHIHLSEQPRENTEVLAAYGVSPTRLLADAGALSARTSVVHATHLDEADIALIGAAGATVVMCPTTEADLGDGIGPARALHDAGAVLALGSDQHAVIDPFLEVRGLEMHERLASGRRGVFSPAELVAASASGSYRALGLNRPSHPSAERPFGADESSPGPAVSPPGLDPASASAGRSSLQVGDPLDLVELATDTVRTVGARPAQLLLVATSADVRRVLVGGRVVADTGVLVGGAHPADLLREALAVIDSAHPPATRLDARERDRPGIRTEPGGTA